MIEVARVKMYFVYLIESLKNGQYYVGQTQDLEERIKRHNQGRNIYYETL